MAAIDTAKGVPWQREPIRLPTGARATASGFVRREGPTFGGLTAPIITYFAINRRPGFAFPIAVGAIAGCVSGALAAPAGPETRGRELMADLVAA